MARNIFNSDSGVKAVKSVLGLAPKRRRRKRRVSVKKRVNSAYYRGLKAGRRRSRRSSRRRSRRY